MTTDIEISDMPDLPAPAEDGTIQPEQIADDGGANDTMRYLSYWYREDDKIEQQYAAEKLKLAARYAAAKEFVGKRIHYHEQGLWSFLRAIGKTKWRGLFGQCRIQKGRRSTLIVDEEAFMAWTVSKDEEVRKVVLKTTVKPSIKGINEFMQSEEGELPPGVDVKVGEEHIVVEAYQDRWAQQTVAAEQQRASEEFDDVGERRPIQR